MPMTDMIEPIRLVDYTDPDVTYVNLKKLEVKLNELIEAVNKLLPQPVQ